MVTRRVDEQMNLVVEGKLFPILSAHKIVLLWPAPTDDIDDEMGAEEGS